MEATSDQQPQVHLQTREHEELLTVIDTLRSQGTTNYIDLPQLVVCGDQSAGKSSVLEAISGGVRFPAKEETCTRFATELVLRRDSKPKANISIVPDVERPQAEKDALIGFQAPSTSLDLLPTIMEAAAEAMGIDNEHKSFSKDILRVELCGPTQPHLSLVDLPGITHAPGKHQSPSEVKAVQDLVQSYMEKPRSIILAVVSAQNDLNNQIITTYAKTADPEGARTLGIVTKPDTLYDGSDKQKVYLELAEESTSTFKLGWHYLRNRDYTTKDSTAIERDEAEQEFFQRVEWSSVPRSMVGISALRLRLSNVLVSCISQELPRLVRDVRTGITECQEQLKKLGPARRTLDEQRNSLFEASQMFFSLMKDSVHGSYHDAFFGSSESDTEYNKRLRAVVQNALRQFALDMRSRGHFVQLVDHFPEGKASAREFEPKPVTRDMFLDYVQMRMARTRGRELPGTFNPDVVGDLFFDQARPWTSIVHSTRERLIEATQLTIGLVLEHVVHPSMAEQIQRHLIRPNVDRIGKALFEKADEVLKPHLKGRPMTFNHYFTENMWKKRRTERRKVMEKKINDFFRKGPEAARASKTWKGELDLGDLLDHFAEESDVDFDRFVCIEATNAMEAYYSVCLLMYHHS